jgi:putative transposase
MISFKQRHFKQDMILMPVRWYVAYPVSYRDIEELTAERGLKVDHSTINRWVIHYTPQLDVSFRKHFKRSVSASWRIDET